MTSWQTKKLRDLTSKIGSGITPHGGSDVFTNSGVLFIRSQNIRHGSVDMSDKKYIPTNIDRQMSSSRVARDDILYNITGASIGRSAVYESTEPANVNQHVCIVRLKNDSPKFINYALSSSVGKRNLWSFQAGGNREGLNFQQLGSFKIDLPEINEQERIVRVLETWDKYIEKLERKIELKEQLKKGLMQQLLANNDSDWQTVSLSEVTDLLKDGTHGSHKDAEKGPALLSAKDIKDGEVSVGIDSRKISNKDFGQIHKTYRLRSGDILLTIVGTLGRVAQIKNYQNDFTFQRSVAILRFSEQVNSRFMYYLLSANNFKKELLRRESKGAQGGVYLGEIGKIKLTIPDKTAQTKITTILDTISDDLDLLKRALVNARNQKKYLLKNLITGAIRTPETLAPKGAK